eukprot:5053538-Alexandrium_andersonii.AAC.1
MTRLPWRALHAQPIAFSGPSPEWISAGVGLAVCTVKTRKGCFGHLGVHSRVELNGRSGAA